SQDQYPHGATILGVIGGSDKTIVTRGTGNLEMHPTFFTLANINSEVRMKATSHAWMCKAIMPTPVFCDVHSEIQTLLEAWLWHRCMDIISCNLKHAAKYGQLAPDPHGVIRATFTPLVAWTADLPEQQLIACTSKSASP
ncbi:hypothetical protein SERLA73DRAFT_26649, partial [Serpula lacrymans var. lacrymans S7.3]